MSTDSDRATPKSAEQEPPQEAAGAARLRESIDRGGSGDKVAFMDPAAAPLGTDAEAAGTPPTAAQVSMAMQEETGRAPEADRKPGPADMQGARSRPTAMWALLALVVLVIVVIAAVVA